MMVFLAFFTKEFPVQSNGLCWCDSQGVEMPAVWWKKPRPSKHIYFSNYLNDEWLTSGYEHYFKRHSTLTNYIKLIGFLSLTEDNISRIEVHIGCTIYYQLKVAFIKPLKKWVFLKYSFYPSHN